MKKLVAICAVVALMLAVNGTVSAAIVNLSGTLSGVDFDTDKDNGEGNHDYAMDRTAAKTFYWSDGSTVSITGTVDVRDLTSGSYLQIGLVDKAQADVSLDTYSHGGYMFNNSALATFYAGTRNYARLSDDVLSHSDQLLNPTSATVGVFDFVIDIFSNGTMNLTLHGDSEVSTTYTYGTRNWWDGDPFWEGAGELENGSYLISQLWIDTADMVNPVNAEYDITGTSVPEPATMLLLGLGGLFLRRRKSA